ncbi:MAG: HlyC/CorC family transporter [Desulfobacteraceae bacterium]|nr:MAG: HlyC/CorC family transporter [Desulfobacteraceae bacterium]
MNLLLIYFFVALGFSFLCSLLESVLLSITPGFMGAYEKKSPMTGRLLRWLKKDIDRPLAAILSLNTIAHTVGAAGVGAQSMVVFGSEYVAITSAVLTFFILVFTEIIPKTYGALYWRKLAPFTARTVQTMIVLLYPLVFLCLALTRLISKGKSERGFSREEFLAIADIGFKEGKFREEESRIIKNLFLLRKLSADDIMTPRTVMFTLPASMTVGEAIKIPDIKFSRIPIYQDDADHIVGFVLKGDIYLEASRGNQDKPLISLRRDLPAVPETVHLVQIFERFLKQRQHAVLVVDEHGGVAGIVTMEDIIETLLGIEIMDETDMVADMRALARQQWLKRARSLGIVIEKDK